MKKGIVSVLLTAVLTSQLYVPVSAYDLPSDFWGDNSIYEEAVKKYDDDKIISSGVNIINLISKEPKNDQTTNILGSRSYEVAQAYYRKGDYANAAKYFEFSVPYTQELGWEDSVKIANAYVLQLKSRLDVYEHTNELQKSYGVKNEPQGVLRGQIAETMEQSDSMVILYLEYGQPSDFTWAKHILKTAHQQNKSVELALNFPNQGDTARSIQSADTYLASLHSMLSNHTNVPIYLRIGAEMNIWGNKCTPNEFIRAYKVIVDALRDLPNISMVWSVAETSTWKSATWPYDEHDFYPGDDYVDWVGTTCYTKKYFEAKKWSDAEVFNETYYKTGYNADPVLIVENIVKTYGDRKPIMISECGSAYYTGGEVNDTDGAWAANYMNQIYAFIPMVYPQVKLIAYFNKHMSNEVQYYDLDGSSELKTAYASAVKSPWFIQNDNNSKAETFFKKAGDSISANGNITLSAYPHLYGSDSVTVSYYIDDELYKSTSEIPYTADIKALNGTHTLTVKAQGNNGNSTEKKYKITSYKKAENADDFSDTETLSEIQKAAVNYVMQKGIITGYDDNTLKPYNTITRAEFAAVICRMKNYRADNESTFDDMSGHWANKYVQACVNAKAINGTGDNKFSPNDNVTFEQSAKIVTIVSGFALSDEKYPDGFISVAEKYKLLNNLTDTAIGSSLNRIDAAMLIYNAVNNS